MGNTSDLIIGMLIGAVMVFGYLTIHFYLRCKKEKKLWKANDRLL